MPARPVPESDRFQIDRRRLRLYSLAAGVSLREVERRTGLSQASIGHAVIRGWIRRRVAERIAWVLGCDASAFEMRRGVSP